MMINEYDKQTMIDWDLEFLAGNPNLSDEEREMLIHAQPVLVQGMYINLLSLGLAQSFRGNYCELNKSFRGVGIVQHLDEDARRIAAFQSAMLQQYKPTTEETLRNNEALENLNKNE